MIYLVLIIVLNILLIDQINQIEIIKLHDQLAWIFIFLIVINEYLKQKK